MGDFDILLCSPGWRNWQTQRTQNPPGFGPWGFNSPSRHQPQITRKREFTREASAWADGVILRRQLRWGTGTGSGSRSHDFVIPNDFPPPFRNDFRCFGLVVVGDHSA